MQLEDMSKDELIALVKRQEQELAASKAECAVSKVFGDLMTFGTGIIQVAHIPYQDMFQPVPQQTSSPGIPDSSNSVEFDGIKPLPVTPAEALKELADLFYVNVECSRAEHVVGMVESALQPVNVPAASVQPDERKYTQADAALLDALVEAARDYGNSELLRGTIEELLAAHPANVAQVGELSDEAMAKVKALAWKWHRESVRQGFACSEPAQELFEALGWPADPGGHLAAAKKGPTT